MHIKELRLRNFKCYADTKLVLDRLAYSVVASRDGDAERSNYSGKSTLLEAVPFCLYGEHTARTEDEWITTGQLDGHVGLVIANDRGDVLVERSRKRGKSTQLVVQQAGEPPMKGDEAQRYIDEMLGLSAEDFRNTAYFEQKCFSKMIVAKPQERMDIIGAWLRLDPLVKAEDIARAELNELGSRAQTCRVSQQHYDETLVRELAGGTAETLASKLAKYQDVLVDVKAELEVAQAEAAEGRKLAVQRSKVAEYERIAAEGKGLKDELDGMGLAELVKAEQQLTELERDLSIAAGAAKREERDRKRVALGQFDGVCPVAGITCPAKDEINTKSKSTQKALKIAVEAAEQATMSQEDAAAQLQAARAKSQAAQRLKARVDVMRDQIRALKPDYEAAKADTREVDLDALEQAVRFASDAVLNAKAEVAAVERSLAAVGFAQSERDRFDEEAKRLDQECAVLREVLCCVGRNGAQRRVAELALRTIEDGANDAMVECGIDLRVEVVWAREGQGLAKQCEACGAPFPTSAKVKRCERCGAERGQLMVQKLDLVLSNRSGAADDLVGAAIQLSASAWLRRERGSGWGVAIVDEPFSAMDSSNRRAFATHLVALLRQRYGYEQAFVVSHTAETVAMMPGRIEINNQNGRATARVVA